MNTKNIGIIVSDIALAGGTERAAINLANNLAGNGLNVSIISIYSNDDATAFYNVHESISIHHFNLVFSSSLTSRILSGYYVVTNKLKQFLGNKEWHLIGTTHAINFLLVFVKFSKPQNKYIGCEHLSYDFVPKYSQKLRKILYKNLDAVVVLTQNDLEKYVQNGKNINCFVIPNEISFFPEESAKLESKNLLAIGRFELQKGFDLLIGLVEKPLQQNRDWTLTIVGNGSMKSQIINELKRKDWGHQVIIKEPTKDIINEYMDASIYLLPSRFEGFPMVLLEAKACGLPIVAYDCPTGPKEIILPNDGVLVPMNDMFTFSNQVKYLMNDQAKRKLLGENARINVSKYSSEAIYSKWDKLFLSLNRK